MVNDPRLLNFHCPLCGSNNCSFVGVHRKNGAYIVIKDFFQCAGCSVMFTDPIEFSRLTRDTFTGKWRERKATRDFSPDGKALLEKDETGGD